MANIQVKDGAGDEKYLKASGAGTDLDAHVPEHLDTNSAALLAATVAIQAAVEIIDNMIDGTEGQVDVVSSALPTGAATAANQLADGHNVTVDNAAGASAVNVQDGGNTLTVDGTVTADAGTDLNTSALALEAGGNLADVATDTGNMDTSLNNIEAGFAAEDAALGSGVLIQGDDGTDRKNIAVDTDGNVQVDIVADAAGLATDAKLDDIILDTAAIEIATEASQTALEIMDDWDESDRAKVNIIAGQAGVTAGAGAVAANTPRTTLASDDPAVALLGTIDTDTSALAGAVSGSEVQVDVVAALPTGTNTIGNVGIAPQTSGGYTIYRDIDLDETGILVKSSAGQVFGYFMTNLASSTIFVKFYNKATAPTVGTDTPVLTIPLEADQAANVEFLGGIAFATGIGIGATTGVADNDTGAPGANEVIVNVFYK